MRLLLDTNALIWWLEKSPKLSRRTYAEINDPDNPVWVSAASPWEIEIKRAAGRLEAPTDVLGQIDRAGFVPLPITLEHGVAAGCLPPHHRDPFDRMLIAQAQLEGLTIVTHDRRFESYGLPLLQA